MKSRFSVFPQLAFALALALAAVLSFASSGCGDDDASGSADAMPVIPDAAPHVGPDAAPGEIFDMKAEDFECVLHWDKVRNFRITNKLGHQAEALAVANSASGGSYPVGTVIQLVPFEAMVKRQAGWNPPSGDWEFFALDVKATGTTINSRGNATVNGLDNPCLPCHSKAQPQFDFVCEKSHGCDPLTGITDDIILNLQNGDARCQ